MLPCLISFIQDKDQFFLQHTTTWTKAFFYPSNVPVPLSQGIQQDLGRDHHDLELVRHPAPDRRGQLAVMTRTRDLGHCDATVPADRVGLLPHKRDICYNKEGELLLNSTQNGKNIYIYTFQCDGLISYARTSTITFAVAPPSFFCLHMLRTSLRLLWLSSSRRIISLMSMAATRVLPLPVSITAMTFSCRAFSYMSNWYCREIKGKPITGPSGASLDVLWSLITDGDDDGTS